MHRDELSVVSIGFSNNKPDVNQREIQDPSILVSLSLQSELLL